MQINATSTKERRRDEIHIQTIRFAWTNAGKYKTQFECILKWFKICLVMFEATHFVRNWKRKHGRLDDWLIRTRISIIIFRSILLNIFDFVFVLKENDWVHAQKPKANDVFFFVYSLVVSLCFVVFFSPFYKTKMTNRTPKKWNFNQETIHLFYSFLLVCSIPASRWNQIMFLFLLHLISVHLQMQRSHPTISDRSSLTRCRLMHSCVNQNKINLFHPRSLFLRRCVDFHLRFSSRWRTN